MSVEKAFKVFSVDCWRVIESSIEPVPRHHSERSRTKFEGRQHIATKTRITQILPTWRDECDDINQAKLDRDTISTDSAAR